jgi:hypothetical protein
MPVGFREWLYQLKNEHPRLFRNNDREAVIDLIIQTAPSNVIRDFIRRALGLEWNDIANPLRVRKPKRTALQEVTDRALANYLSMTTAIGKPLGDCERHEVMALSGWYAKLTKRMKLGDRVRDVWTNAEIKKILK